MVHVQTRLSAGFLFSVSRPEKRVIASDPHGQTHMTAFGVLTVIKAMLKSEKGGLVAVEMLLDMAAALQQMKDAGIAIYRE